MRTRIFTAAALFSATLIASSSPALARAKADTTDASTSATAPTAAQGEKKICRQLPNSASRMTERACFTKSQWKQIQKEAM